jgi:hypothetical protein
VSSISAAVIVAVVVWMLAVQWEHGRWPVGFPWSVLSLLCLAALMASSPMTRGDGSASRWRFVVMAAALLFSLLWFLQGR